MVFHHVAVSTRDIGWVRCLRPHDFSACAISKQSHPNFNNYPYSEYRHAIRHQIIVKINRIHMPFQRRTRVKKGRGTTGMMTMVLRVCLLSPEPLMKQRSGAKGVKIDIVSVLSISACVILAPVLPSCKLPVIQTYRLASLVARPPIWHAILAVMFITSTYLCTCAMLP